MTTMQEDMKSEKILMKGKVMKKKYQKIKIRMEEMTENI